VHPWLSNCCVGNSEVCDLTYRAQLHSAMGRRSVKGRGAVTQHVYVKLCDARIFNFLVMIVTEQTWRPAKIILPGALYISLIYLWVL